MNKSTAAIIFIGYQNKLNSLNKYIYLFAIIYLFIILGSINTTPIDTGVKTERMRSHCICHWLFSCFRGDETTPVNSLDTENQQNSEVNLLAIYQNAVVKIA